MKKIEINILLIILIEAIFLLLFFHQSFLNIIIGIVLGIIIILLTKNIKKNKFTKLLLTIISIILYLLCLHKVTCFISSNLLKSYSTFIITLSLLSISIFMANKNYHALVKSCEIIFYLIIFIKIITLILCIPLINFSNLIIDTTINYQFTYIALLIFYLFKSIYYLSDYQLTIKDCFLSFINPISIKVLSLLVMGNILSKIYLYPYVSYLKGIKYFDFIERIDGILSFEYAFCFIILLAFLLFQIISYYNYIKIVIKQQLF